MKKSGVIVLVLAVGLILFVNVAQTNSQLGGLGIQGGGVLHIKYFSSFVNCDNCRKVDLYYQDLVTNYGKDNRFTLLSYTKEDLDELKKRVDDLNLKQDKDLLIKKTAEQEVVLSQFVEDKIKAPPTLIVECKQKRLNSLYKDFTERFESDKLVSADSKTVDGWINSLMEKCNGLDANKHNIQISLFNDNTVNAIYDKLADEYKDESKGVSISEYYENGEYKDGIGKISKDDFSVPLQTERYTQYRELYMFKDPKKPDFKYPEIGAICNPEDPLSDSKIVGIFTSEEIKALNGNPEKVRIWIESMKKKCDEINKKNFGTNTNSPTLPPGTFKLLDPTPLDGDYNYVVNDWDPEETVNLQLDFDPNIETLEKPIPSEVDGLSFNDKEVSRTSLLSSGKTYKFSLKIPTGEKKFKLTASGYYKGNRFEQVLNIYINNPNPIA